MRAEEIEIANAQNVLIFGLGLLGGGVAAANFFIKRGACVTISDIKAAIALQPSLDRLEGDVRLDLGGHSNNIFDGQDLIILNPDIPVRSQWAQKAIEEGRNFQNEATIFYQMCPIPIISVTGTRGKTTTTNWISHFLRTKATVFKVGNSPNNPFLQRLDEIAAFHTSNPEDNTAIVVNEIPSYHLEYFPYFNMSPEISIVTNIYVDHLNRHKSVEEYAWVKSQVFQRQLPHQSSILNYDSSWREFLEEQPCRAKRWYFSQNALPKKLRGAYVEGDAIMLRFDPEGKAIKLVDIAGFVERWGIHNLSNLLASFLAIYIHAGVPKDVENLMNSLPSESYRQELVYESLDLRFYNDGAATSPDGSLAAFRRFAQKPSLFIVGGTDRELDFDEWAEEINRMHLHDRLIFLPGSATDKMLRKVGKQALCASDFSEALSLASDLANRNFMQEKPVNIIFTPGAKSFEHYTNEFVRAEAFNKALAGFLSKVGEI